MTGFAMLLPVAQEHLTVTASRGQSWGGTTVALVAAAIFVGFSAYIVVQRLRHGGDRGRDDD